MSVVKDRKSESKRISDWKKRREEERKREKKKKMMKPFSRRNESSF